MTKEQFDKIHLCKNCTKSSHNNLHSKCDAFGVSCNVDNKIKRCVKYVEYKEKNGNINL